MADFLAGEKATADNLNRRTKRLLTAAFRVGDTSATSGTNLLTWATTNAVNLPALTVIRVELEARWSGTTNADEFGFRIYDTSTAGTMLTDDVSQSRGGGPYNARCSHAFTTGASPVVGQVFVATIHRVTGSGTALVKANSVVRVFSEGDAGIYSTV